VKRIRERFGFGKMEKVLQLQFGAKRLGRPIGFLEDEYLYENEKQ